MDEVTIIERVLFRLRVVDDCFFKGVGDTFFKADIPENAPEMLIRRVYGQTVRQIADAVGIGRSAVHSALGVYGTRALASHASRQDRLYEDGWQFRDAETVRDIIKQSLRPKEHIGSKRTAFCPCRPFPLQSSRFRQTVKNVDGKCHRNVKTFTCVACRKRWSAPDRRKLLRPGTPIEAIIGLDTDQHEASAALYHRITKDTDLHFDCINAERLRSAFNDPMPFDD